MIPQYVTRFFDEFIDKKFEHKEELKRFFKRHPRRPLVERNTCEQLERCGVQGLLGSEEMYRQVVYSVTETFCKLSIYKKENEIKSTSQKILDEQGDVVDFTLVEEPELPEGVTEGFRDSGSAPTEF
jgi:hypothetical protein